MGCPFADRTIPECVETAGIKTSPNLMVSRIAQDMRLCEAILKARRPIFVGHNQFFDLCFIYQTFIGPLLDSSLAFKKEIHRLFPRMIDTKYLASRGDPAIAADSSLGSVYSRLAHEEVPRVQRHVLMGSGEESPHQAGHDSKSLSLLFALFNGHSPCLLVSRG